MESACSSFDLHFEDPRVDLHLPVHAIADDVEVRLHAVEPLGKVGHLEQAGLAVDVERRMLGDEGLDALRDVRKDVCACRGRDAGGAGLVRTTPDDGGAPRDRRRVVDVEEARFGFAMKNADERAVDRVVEAERRQDQAERLPHGDALQLADERARRLPGRARC